MIRGMGAPDPDFSETLRLAEDADVSNWLDAFAARECSPDEFLDEILRREHEEPDVGWEALALLDQQFRRQKISHDDFTALKARLYQHLVGSSGDIPHTAPSVATPVPVSVPRPALTQAPMIAIRPVPLVDIPVITTVTETAAPAMPVEVSLHCEIRVSDKLCNRYRVVEILRRNDSGTLVEAVDELKIELPGVRKRVAIQVVDETLSREPEFLHRVGRLQCLSHPAIARLFDVDADDGAMLLVMELLNGPSVHDLLSRSGGPLHPGITAALRAVAGALIYAHSQGVTHGNVSAANVIITQTSDFRLQGFEMQDPRHSVDAAADREAFARLAYQMLSGPEAFNAQRVSPHLRSPRGITRDQWRALRDTLNGKGKHRRDVLLAFAGDVPPTSHRGWGIGALWAVILGIAGYLYVNAEPEPSSATAAPNVSAPEVVTPAAAPAPPPPPMQITAPAAPAPAPAPVVTVTAALSRPSIDLPVGPSVVETTSPVARVWVRRRGNLEGVVTFKWWTENGSAEAERDFRSVAPRTQTIPAGASGVEVLVPLMPDPERREARTFWVKIDEAGRGATLGSRTLIQVAIVPPGYPVQR
ncbi:MAG: protein kinase [Pseudomonadota bacterium]